MTYFKSLFILFLGFTVVGCKLEVPSKPPTPLKITPDIESVTSGNTEFAFDLYSQLKSRDGNLFFSPYSISSALGMTFAGARGQTETEMAATLHFDLPQNQLHPAMGSLVNYLNGDGGGDRGYALAVANRIWPRNGLPLLTPFEDIVRADYGADVVSLNYGETEKSRRTINGWVEDKTNDKIKDLIKANVLRPDTALVLTNAIYFKGDWASQFKKSDTRPMPFHQGDGKSTEAQMMLQTGDFGYAELDDGMKILDLPYNTGALSMVVLLPAKPDGLADVEAKLNAEKFALWSSKLNKQEVEVLFPKFKMTSEFELGEKLAKMGMPSAFSPAADFSGITEGGGLSISKVIHKAFVDVNEEGTEAAAATAVIMLESASLVTQFRADHPFVFLIRDNQTGSVLFIGRVIQP